VSTAFIEMTTSIGVNLTPQMLIQYKTYYDYLMERNAVMNLTAITDKEEVYAKHFFDLLCLIKTGPLANLSLLDVGSGAGFPAIPIKIAFPSVQVTIVDALQKRIDFLTTLAEKLHIDDIHLIHGRIEEFDQKNSFDLVTARAVAKLNILTELCLPFVKVGGRFIAMKSIHYEEELNEAILGIRRLGGQLKTVTLYPIDDKLAHVLIIIEKVKPTPDGYPRAFAQIKKKPL